MVLVYSSYTNPNRFLDGAYSANSFGQRLFLSDGSYRPADGSGPDVQGAEDRSKRCTEVKLT